MGLVYAVAVKEGGKGYDMWNKTSVHKTLGMKLLFIGNECLTNITHKKIV